jgi:hypothetical protein
MMRLYQVPIDSFVQVVKVEGDGEDLEQEVTNEMEEFDE